MVSVGDVAAQNPVLVAATVAIGVALAYSLFKSGAAGSAGKKKKGRPALDSTTFQSFPLVEKIIVSPDTRIFRFKLPNPNDILGLPIGQHMYVKAVINGEEVQRAYTPITSDDDRGHFDLMIKVYFKNVHPKFPDGGKLTQHLEGLKPGVDSILVRGPTGRFEYLGCGRYHTKVGLRGYGAPKNVKKIGMIAGGTGITPILQVMRAVLKDPSDQTQLWILFANQTEQDILLREELERCAKDPRVKSLWYTLDRPPANWSFSEGFINEEMVAQRMPAPGADTIILMCGPPPMITYACKPNLEKCGFSTEQMFVF